MLTIVNAVQRLAIFDPTRQYRYSLERRWQPHGPKVTFVMLNPSRADAERDDPTLRACSQFAQRWGYSALEVVNLFAYRTPEPQVLKTVSDPIGVECDRYLCSAAETAEQIVLAWGNWGALYGRDQAVRSLLSDHASKLRCLGLTQLNQPRHPLYLKRTTALSSWKDAQRPC
ncbi:MAG: DUF1643 domain-containing protein [Leptolyngbya sp. SIO4C1]|nr:DUF1643 domain-containing protein [Leptolyngbya sp. SIO4C1]